MELCYEALLGLSVSKSFVTRVSIHTHWRDKGIFVAQSPFTRSCHKIFISFSIDFQPAFTATKRIRSVLVIQRYFEGCFGGSIARSLGWKLSSFLVKWLGCSGGLVAVNQVLLVS